MKTKMLGVAAIATAIALAAGLWSVTRQTRRSFVDVAAGDEAAMLRFGREFLP